MMEQVQIDISLNKCYSKDITDEISKYTYAEMDSESFDEIYTMYDTFLKNGNLEEYYSSFYQKIHLHSHRYFPKLSKVSAKLLTSKLAHVLLSERKKTHLKENISTDHKELSEREADALNYIGGYILHKLYKKLKNSKYYKLDEYQQAMALIKAGQLTEFSGNDLISCLNRGGLWAVKPCITQLLHAVENEFLKSTSLEKEHKINIDLIFSKSVSDVNVIANFNVLSSEASLVTNEDIAADVLHNIIKLYIRVRAFSSARDAVQNFKIKTSSKKGPRQKGLRKEIKRTTKVVESKSKK